jgi:hypothetical protein
VPLNWSKSVCGWWWWVVVVGVETKYSVMLWPKPLALGLGQAEQYLLTFEYYSALHNHVTKLTDRKHY